MPPEMDDERIAEMRRMLKAGEVAFDARAHYGHRLRAEPDDIGLNGLFQSRLSPDEKERRLIRCLLDFLETRGRPNRLDEAYATVYEFRMECRKIPVYVKSIWPPKDAAAPVLRICSVKKQN